MGDLAAEADGVALDGRVEASTRLLDVAGEAEVAGAVRGLGELAKEAPGGLEGLVDVPERAGAAEAGELEAGRRVTLGYRARLVDTDEVEGDAAGAAALEGREALADLLDRGVEGEGERLEVVAEGAGGFGKAEVGQEGGTGEIVGESGLADGARGPGAEAGEVEGGLEQVVVLEKGDLVEELEGLGRGGRVGGEGQAARGPVEAAEGGVGGEGDGKAVAGGEPVGEGGAAIGREREAEGLGGPVDGVEVVVAVSGRSRGPPPTGPARGRPRRGRGPR